jgi:diguanylate cyclase (GGDEF)-like protein/PAS domain S-box-containing protein
MVSSFRRLSRTADHSFLVRATRAGNLAQLCGIALVLAYSLLPGHPSIPGWELATGVAIAAVATALTSIAPWARWVTRRFGVALFVAWSFGLLGLITWFVEETGGATSPAWPLYLALAIFVATSYPFRAAMAILAAVVAINIAVVLTEAPRADPAAAVFKLGTLLVIVGLTAFLATERVLDTQEMTETAELATRRAFALEAAANAARDLVRGGTEEIVAAACRRLGQLGFLRVWLYCPSATSDDLLLAACVPCEGHMPATAIGEADEHTSGDPGSDARPNQARRVAPGGSEATPEGNHGVAHDPARGWLAQRWLAAIDSLARLASSTGKPLVACGGQGGEVAGQAVVRLGDDAPPGWLLARPVGTDENGTPKRHSGATVLIGLMPQDAFFGPEIQEAFGLVAHLIADAVERVSLTTELARSEARLTALVRHAAELVIVLEPTSLTATYVSPAALDVLGIPAHKLIGTAPFELIVPEDLDRVTIQASQLLREDPLPSAIGRSIEGTCRVRRADGEIRTIEFTLTDLRAEPAVAGLVVNAREITERVRSEERKALSEARFRMLAESVPVGTFVVDVRDGKATYEVSYANERAQQLFRGVDAAKAGPHSPLEWANVVHEDDRAAFVERVERTIGGGAPVTLEHRVVRRDGSIMWVEVRLAPVIDEHGVLRNVIGVVDDVTERRLLHERLAHLAAHDPLTGLQNRASFDERLAQALARSRRTKDGVALIFCDLDGFKDVNDRHGHDAGDAVLVEAARRLCESIREHDTAIRYGGDELVVIAEGLTERDALGLATRIKEALTSSYDVGRTTVTISTSIGVAFSADGRVPPAELVRVADAGMYESKRTGAPSLRVLGAYDHDAPGSDPADRDDTEGPAARDCPEHPGARRTGRGVHPARTT